MAPTLRNSTQEKTKASADAATRAGYIRRPRRPPRRERIPRSKRYPGTKGLVNLTKSRGLQHVTRANANSPLLRLPPEIRNMIFEYAMTMRYNLELYYNSFSELSASGFSNYAHKRQRRFLSVRLPEVCRQIYSETATLFYRMNTFSFATEQAMRVWLKKRLPAQLEVIQRLDLLEWDDEKRVDICKDLKDTVCTNLSSLTQDELNADIIGETRWRRMEWIDERDYISTDDEDSWEQIRGDMGSDGDW